MHHRVGNIVTWAGALAWAAVIFSMSAMPGSNVPGKYSTLAHFTEYAILAALLLLALAGRRGSLAAALILAVAVASSYGATDELHQSFVPMRMPDVIDWLTDTAGAFAGGAFAAITAGWLRRRGAR